jgi:hypothetical protein
MHDYHFFFPMFWGLFALTIILARRFTRHRERMRALEVAAKFAEKGLPAPEAVTAALHREPSRPLTRRHQIMNGAVLIAVAVAMLIFGAIMQWDDAANGRAGLHPLFGAAAFPGLIGVVVLIFGLVRRDQD